MNETIIYSTIDRTILIVILVGLLLLGLNYAPNVSQVIQEHLMKPTTSAKKITL